MKKIVIVLYILLCCISVFASWNELTVLDEFGDPTGEVYIGTTTSGTFSNTATSSSPCVVRLVAKTAEWFYPNIRFEFQIHDYDWSYPVSTKSMIATFKFKSDDGTILTLSSPSKYGWNLLYGESAIKLHQFFLNNNIIKVAVSAGTSSYSFTIDVSGYKDEYPKLLKKYNGFKTDVFVLKEYEYDSHIEANRVSKLPNSDNIYILTTIGKYPKNTSKEGFFEYDFLVKDGDLFYETDVSYSSIEFAFSKKQVLSAFFSAGYASSITFHTTKKNKIPFTMDSFLTNLAKFKEFTVTISDVLTGENVSFTEKSSDYLANLK